ncbi:homoserine dehydrogenase, partial [Peptococcaceae bacterium SCADC1_2_3]
IMDAARHRLYKVPGIIKCTCYAQKPIKPIGEVECKYYLRLIVDDRPGVLASIAYAFGDKKVSLASVIQKFNLDQQAEIVLVTHRVKEQNFRAALNLISQLSAVKEVCNFIRVEGEET